MGIFQDFVIKIKNTFSSSNENDFFTAIPYSLLPSFKTIKKEIQIAFDEKLPTFDFLKIEIKLSETNVDWSAIIQFSYENNEESTNYKKINHVNGVVSTEETSLPFGFQPFSSIKNEAIDAFRIGQREEQMDCFSFKLYFPLSPFDTEPLWFMDFEDKKQAIVGADTGSLEMKDLS